jgi:hypothetical protein
LNTWLVGLRTKRKASGFPFFILQPTGIQFKRHDLVQNIGVHRPRPSLMFFLTTDLPKDVLVFLESKEDVSEAKLIL